MMPRVLARLQSTGSGELALEVILLEGLDVRVAANVLLVDEDVGDAALAGHLSESVLDVGTVICTGKVLVVGFQRAGTTDRATYRSGQARGRRTLRRTWTTAPWWPCSRGSTTWRRRLSRRVSRGTIEAGVLDRVADQRRSGR